MSRMLQFAWATLTPSRPVPGRTVLDPTAVRMRVLPQDLDLMMVVNNGSYLQIMDVARFRHVGEMGALCLAQKQSWIGVVAASTVRYHRSLKLGDRFEVTTRVLGWDDRVFYTEHVVTRGEQLCTRGIVGMRFVHRRSRERIAPQEIVKQLADAGDYPVPATPDLPSEVATWAMSWNASSAGDRPQAV